MVKEIMYACQQLMQKLVSGPGVAALREEVLRYRVQKEGMARQAAAALLGSQASAVAKEVLTIWRQLLQELSRETWFRKTKESP